MRYNIDDNGKINGIGDDSWFNREFTGDEPFTAQNALDYRFDFEINQWISMVVAYQYIIIPTDLIPNIKSMVQLVDDVLTDQAFVIHLSKEEIITRNNQRRDIGILPISFTPCTVIDWENGDDARLNAIIDQFNREYNPPRKFDFPCKFDSLQDFETFKQNYSYI